jgi:hypothetical protein
MKHGAIVNCARQVGRDSTPRCKHKVDTTNQPVIIETNVVLDNEIVTLACHDHVVVTIQTQLAGASGPCRHDRRYARNGRGLAFLAAESATHTTANTHDVLGFTCGRVRYKVLDLIGVLGRAIHQHATIFLRDRHGDVSFEVKLVLTAEFNAAMQFVRRVRDCLLGVSTFELFTGQYK